MNLLKHEIKVGRKTFLFWALGVAVLIFAGVVKFTGVAGSGGAVNQLIDQFPRVVLAMLGIVGVDINTFGGYYSILVFFAMLCTALYAMHLGGGAVSREAIDKTYEFLFTKPRSRGWTLAVKLGAGLCYLLAFSLLCFLLSVGAVASLQLGEDFTRLMLLFCLGNFLVGLLFFSLAACLAAVVKRAERGALYANLCFLAAFVLGVAYDSLENGGALRFLSPLKYFPPSDVLAGRLSWVYLLLLLGLSVLLLGGAFRLFQKRDLNAA